MLLKGKVRTFLFPTVPNSGQLREERNALIRRIIIDDPEALAEYDRLTVGPPGNRSGNNQYTSNSGIDHIVINSTITRNSPVGNSKQKGLHELGQKRPDLLEEVKAGLTTTHKANIEAGFRPRYAPGHQDDQTDARLRAPADRLAPLNNSSTFILLKIKFRNVIRNTKTLQ